MIITFNVNAYLQLSNSNKDKTLDRLKMLKNYFTDSLIQIAIVLSLLRIDLQNYLNSSLNDYPEVQEIVLGQSSAFTQTQFHHNQWLNSVDGLYGLGRNSKNIETFYDESVFNDLHSLIPYRGPNAQQNITTLLLVAGQQNVLVGNTPDVNDSNTTEATPVIENVEGAVLPEPTSTPEETKIINQSELSDEVLKMRTKLNHSNK